LVNHKSISWDDRAGEVEIYHVELDAHDALIANGAPAERYRDDGDRLLFHNDNNYWRLSLCPPCAPVSRSRGPAPAAADDGRSGLALIVDGHRLDPAKTAGMDTIFVIPSTIRVVRLVSRDATLAVLGLACDPRALGGAIRRIAMERRLNSITIGASDPVLGLGFHEYEPDDDSVLPEALFALPGIGAFMLTVTPLPVRLPDTAVRARRKIRRRAVPPTPASR